MRAQKILSALLLSVTLGGWSAAAQAASCPSSSYTLPTADFAGNCSRAGGSSTVYCAFDALRDTYDANPSVCPGSSIDTVLWDFGDGSSTWDDTYVSHTYFNVDTTTDGAVTATATIFCANGCSDDRGRFVVFVTLGCPYCINMNTGWD